MPFPFIICCLVSLQKTQWIKTFTEAIASNRSDRWRQTAKVSFKALHAFVSGISKKSADLQPTCIPLADFDGQTFFYVSRRLINESRKCKVASRQRSKKFTWRWLALFTIHAVALTHRGFLRENHIRAEWTHFCSLNKRKGSTQKQSARESDCVEVIWRPSDD